MRNQTLLPSIYRVSHSTISNLLKSGDIETNPGPRMVFKFLKQMFSNNDKKLKLFHLNCQSIVKKRETLQQVIDDLGVNTICGISETW